MEQTHSFIHSLTQPWIVEVAQWPMQNHSDQGSRGPAPRARRCGAGWGGGLGRGGEETRKASGKAGGGEKSGWGRRGLAFWRVLGRACRNEEGSRGIRGLKVLLGGIKGGQDRLGLLPPAYNNLQSPQA